MADEVKKRGRGQPPWEPTQYQRGQVRAWMGAGFTEVQVAEFLNVDPKTLRKHCAVEIVGALPDLFGYALAGLGSALRNGEAWAICFFLKTRGKALHGGVGWSERHEVTGADGKDLFAGLNLELLSDAQFKQLGRLLEAAGAALDTPPGGRSTPSAKSGSALN